MRRLCLLLALVPILHAEPPKPRNGDKLLVINDDGFSSFHSGRYKTADDWKKQMRRFRDTQVVSSSGASRRGVA